MCAVLQPLFSFRVKIPTAAEPEEWKKGGFGEHPDPPLKAPGAAREWEPMRG